MARGKSFFHVVILLMLVTFSGISNADQEETKKWKSIIDFPPESGTSVDNFRKQNKLEGSDKARRALEAMYVEGKSIILSDRANESWDESPEIVDGYYNEALDEARSAWGANHPVAGFIAKNFAEYLLYSLSRRDSEMREEVQASAKTMITEANRIFNDHFTIGHPLLADSYYVMAHVASLEGNYNISLRYLKHALPMYKLSPKANAERISRIEGLLAQTK